MFATTRTTFTNCYCTFYTFVRMNLMNFNKAGENLVFFEAAFGILCWQMRFMSTFLAFPFNEFQFAITNVN